MELLQGQTLRQRISRKPNGSRSRWRSGMAKSHSRRDATFCEKFRIDPEAAVNALINRELRRQSRQTVETLVIRPWSHGGWDARFGMKPLIAFA